MMFYNDNEETQWFPSNLQHPFDSFQGEGQAPTSPSAAPPIGSSGTSSIPAIPPPPPITPTTAVEQRFVTLMTGRLDNIERVQRK